MPIALDCAYSWQHIKNCVLTKFCGVTNYCGVTNFIALPLWLLLRLLRCVCAFLRCGCAILRYGYGNAVISVDDLYMGSNIAIKRFYKINKRVIFHWSLVKGKIFRGYFLKIPIKNIDLRWFLWISQAIWIYFLFSDLGLSHQNASNDI